MKPYLLTFFFVACFAQWYVPGAMIAEQEDLLRHGRLFRFKTEPVDPSDPFRGKYITLDFRDDIFEDPGGSKWERGQTVFVLLEQGTDGFARIADLSPVAPQTEGVDFLETEVGYSLNNGEVRVDYPFDRFYLEESKASQAEQVYWEANRTDSTQTAYALVRIKNGKAALEDVMINDRSIADIVRELNKD
jgi:uncharacterized membrane-anchored protein